MSQARVSITEARAGATRRYAWAAGGRHPNPLRFVIHLVEMVAAMGIGMALGTTAFDRLAGGSSAAEATAQYPVLAVVVLALSMTVPMVAWMRFRGHGLRSCIEMALAMVVPAVPILILYGLGVIADPASAYCCTSMWAMVVLMIYRRSDYGM